MPEVFQGDALILKFAHLRESAHEQRHLLARQLLRVCAETLTIW